MFPAERNYPTHDLELLAIVKSFEEWRNLLEGAQHPIVVHTDNLALKYFMSLRLLSRRQARWAEFLSRFDFKIDHRPGIKNKADGLSRRPDLYPEGTDLTNEKVLLPSDVFISTMITLQSPEFLSRLHHQEPFPPDINEQLSAPDSLWTSVNGLVRDAGDRIVVPEDVSLRTELIQLTHDTPYAGHPGIDKTLELLKRNYYWYGMKSDVIKYVKSCLNCQQSKIYPRRKAGLLQPIPPSTIPWDEITADLIVGLPPSDGYDSVFVVVDRFTKRAHFVATTIHLEAEGAARLYRDHVWKHHGWPTKIITDRGTQFKAKFVIELNKLFGIQTALSTAYHPQTDGQTERTNMELETYLRLYCNYMQDDWYDHLAFAEFAYNNREHSATRNSPFFLEYGRHPRTPVIPVDLPDSPNPAAVDFAVKLRVARDKASKALLLTGESMKKYADRKLRDAPSYQVGQKVWLDTKNISWPRPSRKLSELRTGPFKVVRQISPLAYEINIPKTWHVHPVFHVSLLRPAIINETLHPEPPEPPPELIHGEEEYEAESILQHRGTKRRREYLVKWKGYPNSEATWEHKRDLEHAKEIVKTYEDNLN